MIVRNSHLFFINNSWFISLVWMIHSFSLYNKEFFMLKIFVTYTIFCALFSFVFLIYYWKLEKKLFYYLLLCYWIVTLIYFSNKVTSQLFGYTILLFVEREEWKNCYLWRIWIYPSFVILLLISPLLKCYFNIFFH